MEVTPDDLDVLKFLNNCRSSPWPPYPLPSVPKSEKTVLLALISKIFVHICKEVVLELSGNEPPVPMPCPVKVDYLGMGTVKTWHGTPDARVRGVDIISRKKSEHIEGSYDDSAEEDAGSRDSDGATSLFEAKLKFKDANLSQAIGTCVVSSFTEKACHPAMKAMVPTILIDDAEFHIVLYDCNHDVLLLSESKAISTKGGISKSAVTLLWSVLNHR